jgi:Holliday junction resolvasome RuvABC DNA-binding subunit
MIESIVVRNVEVVDHLHVRFFIGPGWLQLSAMASPLVLERAQEVDNVRILLTEVIWTPSGPHLYVFADDVERRMFRYLQKVDKVGPGTAIKALSGWAWENGTPGMLDDVRLTKATNKMAAQRIILFLEQKGEKW